MSETSKTIDGWQAEGCHVLIQLPPRANQTQAGVIIPSQANTRQFYGRILSVGTEVESSTIKPGRIAVYAAAGKYDVEMGQWLQGKEQRGDGFIAVAESMILCTISASEALEKGLQLDPVAPADQHVA